MPKVVGNKIVDAVREAAQARNGLAVAAALNVIEPHELAVYFHTRLADDVDAPVLTTGLPASPGAASGRIVLSADAACDAQERGERVILVRSETTPDDVLGMQASQGILTVRGGMVSHAAVVARGWGIPAVVGAIDVQLAGGVVTIGDTDLREGDQITIDGSSGNVYAGDLGTTGAEPPPELDVLLAWADTVARDQVEVRANADTRGDAAHGRELGAQGIGLCRTEHMFLSAERLPVVRRFILANDATAEEAALAELQEVQTEDFETLLEAMDGLPVTVRLLDPPLHEFLPDLLDLTAREARGDLDAAQMVELDAVRHLHEANPMIGTRGVRLGVVRPGVYEMQVRALCTAAANLSERGLNPHVEIMVPLVVDAEELRIVRGWVHGVIDEIGHPEFRSDVITVGAMVETPRAALTAGALAEHADFFSFGTNDLTQMTYAFSRDDVEATLLPAYLAHGILPANPFAELDQDGVGELVRIGCEAARHANAGIKLGACGEHAGHPESAGFLVRLGIDSVSCSPFRIPMARLGVAQALLECGRVHINEVEFDYDLSSAESVAAEQATSDDAPSDAPAPSTGAGVDIDEAIVLHVLQLRGFVTVDGFHASLGDHPAELLDQLVADGHVRHIEARGMYGLMPSGKERHAELLAQLSDESLRSALAEPYERFIELNHQLKELCTDWQMRDADTPNDHSDADYDRGCVERLTALCAATRPVLEEMAGSLGRLARYADRLDVAAECVAGGDNQRFTGVMCESFHDIWMELHEDLIVLQGIDRVAEGSF